MATKYKVEVQIRGTVSRPLYTSTETVWAKSPNEARALAKYRLQLRAFGDVPLSDMHIQSITVVL